MQTSGDLFCKRQRKVANCLSACLWASWSASMILDVIKKKIDRDRLMTVKYFIGLKIRMKKQKTEQQEVKRWSLVTCGM